MWRLSSGPVRSPRIETVKTRGNLATNDGEIAVNWALDGHGIVMRAEWDIARLANGESLSGVGPSGNFSTGDERFHAAPPR